jgi:hypothetical protein
MKVKIVAIIGIAVLAWGLLYWSWPYLMTTLSTTSWTEYDDETMTRGSLQQPGYTTKNTWHSEPTVKHPIFPHYSPDGRFYLTVREKSYGLLGKLWLLEMFRAGDDKKIGTFAHRRISYRGWRVDSSGFYVRRVGVSVGGAAFLFEPWRFFEGPLEVALVPEKEYQAKPIEGEK